MIAYGPPDNAEQWLRDAYEVYGYDAWADVGVVDRTLMEDKIERNPYNPDQWLRQLYIEVHSDYVGLSPEGLLAEGDRHLAKFAEIGGIALPEEKRYITKPSFEQVEAAAVYSVTRHIEGEVLGTPANNPDEYTALHGIANAVTGYYEWAAATNERLVLSDIVRPCQYIYGQGLEDHKPKLYLIDTETHVAPRNCTDSNLEKEEHYFQQLKWYLDKGCQARIDWNSPPGSRLFSWNDAPL